jgi:PmbA protein
MDPAEVGRIAARRAVDQLGSIKGKTQKVPVVFEPLMAVQLMGSIAGCLSGSALYRGATFLAGRIGERIGSENLTLTDEPLLPGRPGSRPFDGEGVATRRTVLFDKGELKAFLFDVYTARRTEQRTTGSAARGIDSGPMPSSANLVLEPGTMAPEAIIAGVQSGLYLTTLMGFGFNPTTGDFSRGAAGFWIENGEIAYPVTEINISGRMEEMLGAIDAVGSDLAWFGGAAAPTIRIAEMTVSGA